MKRFFIISRIVFILGLPLLATYLIYSNLSPNYCLSLELTSNPVEEDSLKRIQTEVSESLEKKLRFLQSFAPLLQLGSEWFKYDVEFTNNLRIALIVSRPYTVTISTTTLHLSGAHGSTTIPYDEKRHLGSALTGQELINIIEQFRFEIHSPPILVSPNEYLFFETAPNLSKICVSIKLQKIYLLLIYIEIFIVLGTFLVLLREIWKFTINGWES